MPEDDRPVWATAMLAGTRRGELLGLEWPNVDFKAGVLHVKRSYDPTSGTFGRPKSKHGVRSIPITTALTAYLRERALRSGRRMGLVFGPTGTSPAGLPAPAAARRRGLAGCRSDPGDPPGMPPPYASMYIVAGVNAHALCRYMGHSSIAVTFDLYGHLFPGNESQAAELLDAYLECAFITPLSDSRPT